MDCAAAAAKRAAMADRKANTEERGSAAQQLGERKPGETSAW